MKTVIFALMIFVAYPALARQDQTPPPQPVTFYDVLELPARIDEPKLEKNGTDYSLTCAVANRSSEPLIGLRFALLLVDANDNRRITRMTWDEAAAVPAYSIKTFKFHPSLKDELRTGNLFLAVDEVIGRETIWRTVDADKLLRAYAGGDHSLTPKVQKLQNKFDNTQPRVIFTSLPKPRP